MKKNLLIILILFFTTNIDVISSGCGKKMKNCGRRLFYKGDIQYRKSTWPHRNSTNYVAYCEKAKDMDFSTIGSVFDLFYPNIVIEGDSKISWLFNYKLNKI